MQQGPPFILIGLIFIIGVLAFGAVIIAVALSRRGRRASSGSRWPRGSG